MGVVGGAERQTDGPVFGQDDPLLVGRERRLLVDLISRRAFEFLETDQGRDPRVVPIPPEIEDEVAVLRAARQPIAAALREL